MAPSARRRSCHSDLPDTRGSFSISQRTLQPTGSWLIGHADGTSLPSFYLWESDGCGSTAERSALRKALGNHSAETLLPNGLSQYLIDYHLIGALERHPRRELTPEGAEWHFLAAAPFTSFVVGSLGLLGGREAHRNRMHALTRCLDALPWWHSRRLWPRRPPFVLIQPYFGFETVLGLPLALKLVHRHSQVAPVVIGTVDRTHGRMTARFGHARLRLFSQLFAQVINPRSPPIPL